MARNRVRVRVRVRDSVRDGVMDRVRARVRQYNVIRRIGIRRNGAEPA